VYRVRNATAFLAFAAAFWLVPLTLSWSVNGIRDGIRGGREDAVTARRRIFGRYADGVERIKASIPQNGEYLLVGSNDEGVLFFIQYDLAPRRAWNTPPPFPTLAALRSSGRPPGAPRFAVLAHGASEAPELIALDDVFGEASR